jgi:hypothetical protein
MINLGHGFGFGFVFLDFLGVQLCKLKIYDFGALDL